MQSDIHVGYTINPGGRGTLDLLWSCLVTIFLCTWTVQRLQVVPWSYSAALIFRKKGFWMLITLLCPEYVTWIAVQQWQSARKLKASRELGFDSWTMQQAFYIEMGGFEVQLHGAPTFQANETGYTVELENGVCYTIRSDDLILLMKEKIIPLPDIRSRELKERSKSDHFARLITLIQVLYFVMISFGRLGSGLPISPLEVSTLAFVCCAAFVEYFWWNKPQELRSATLASINPDRLVNFISVFPKLLFNLPEQDLAEKISLKLFFNRILGERNVKRNAIHAVWIGCIFNGIHVSAWAYSFPTPLEQQLWRIASVGACAAVVLMWAATFIRPKIAALLLSGLFAILYCACRVYLMVEIFAGLRSVPANLYRSAAWQNALPGV